MSTSSTDTEIKHQFSVLKRDSREPQGPYDEEELTALLNNHELTADDLVFYDEIGEWRAIGDVFEIEEQISHFIDDGQDTEKVAAAFREISDVIANDEHIYYIAVQDRTGILNKAKRSVAITELHVYLLDQRRVGFELESHPWHTITNTLMRDEGKGLGTFSILLGAEKRIDVFHIPLKQVQRLFQLSQEMQQANA